MKFLEDYLEKEKQRQENDALRFQSIDGDTCQLCEANGPDKRSLFILCMYAVHEVVPEAIDMTNVDGFQDRGYYLRICKSCRARLLCHLGVWRNECLAMRNVEKDSDGDPVDYDPEKDICVRINGAITRMTLEEWEEYRGLRETSPTESE